jgi:carbonic anhydrase/acetyltransferase-like protein (isoleucine patch superfamily)
MHYEFGGQKPAVAKSAYIAPTAVLIGQVSVGESSSIWFQTVIRADINRIEIGETTNIQDGCLLHVTQEHPLIIKNRVTLGHGAIVHGCVVEDECLIAMGAIVLDGCVIGARSIVAAGALVTEGTQIPPNSLVMGAPAKVVRQVTNDDRERVKRTWLNYKQYADIYKREIPALDAVGEK